MSSKLSHDMETTKVALENERKIQQLQMQAINALWKKVSTLQPAAVNSSVLETAAATTNSTGIEPNSTAVVQDLAKTCSVLTNQVRNETKNNLFEDYLIVHFYFTGESVAIIDA